MPRAKKTDVLTSKEKRSLQSNGFYSDFEKDNMLYGVLIRSPASTGKIKNIEVFDLPENYFYYTADDIPGKNQIEINGTETSIFGSGFVNYSGEPLGILLGSDRTKLKELMNNVSVSFDIETLEAALNNVMKNQKRPILKLTQNPSNEDISEFVSQLNDLPSLDSLDAIETDGNSDEAEKIENNVLAKREIKTGIFQSSDLLNPADKLQVENELFKQADFISKEKYSYSIINPKWQETNGAFCYMESKNLHVCVPTKWTSSLQKHISQVLNIPIEKIFIHKTKTSGISAHGLFRANQIAIQAALACYLTKKPVKLILTQEEQETFLPIAVKGENKQRISINKDGKIKAIEIEINIDAGNSNPFAQEIADRMTISACNFYRPENLHITTTVFKSKNPSTSLFIQNIEAQAFFAIENHMQQLANITGIFPDEIREINSVLTKKNSDFPFDINHSNFSQTIQNTIKISDFNRKYAAFHMDAVHRTLKNSNPFFALHLRGIGIASAYNSSGYLGESIFSTGQKIEVSLNLDNTLVIKAVKPSEVISELWKQTASDILQIDKSKIIIDSNYEIENLPEYPEEAGCNITVLNNLVRKSCMEIQRKRFKQPLPIISKKTVSASTKKLWNKENFSGNPYNSISSATAIVEIELDTYTYSEKVKGIWITVDCGEVFDKSAAEHSILLEIQQELSNLVKDKTFTCNNCVINFVESNSAPTQINGLVHNVLPAAFTSALSLALTTHLTKLPCTENQILKLMKNREVQAEQNSENEKDSTDQIKKINTEIEKSDELKDKSKNNDNVDSLNLENQNETKNPETANES